jgi:hypothetical protein
VLLLFFLPTHLFSILYLANPRPTPPTKCPVQQSYGSTPYNYALAVYDKIKDVFVDLPANTSWLFVLAIASGWIPSDPNAKSKKKLPTPAALKDKGLHKDMRLFVHVHHVQPKIIDEGKDQQYFRYYQYSSHKEVSSLLSRRVSFRLPHKSVKRFSQVVGATAWDMGNYKAGKVLFDKASKKK